MILPAATTESLEHIRRNFRLIRSKDAGPFMLTIDLFFADPAVHQAFLTSRVLDEAIVAELYRVAPEQVERYVEALAADQPIAAEAMAAIGELAERVEWNLRAVSAAAHGMALRAYLSAGRRSNKRCVSFNSRPLSAMTHWLSRKTNKRSSTMF